MVPVIAQGFHIISTIIYIIELAYQIYYYAVNPNCSLILKLIARISKELQYIWMGLEGNK